jgi:hypothetical protein
LPPLLTTLLLLLAIEDTSSLLAPRLCLTIKRADVLPRDDSFCFSYFLYSKLCSVRFARRSPRGHADASMPPALTPEISLISKKNQVSRARHKRGMAPCGALVCFAGASSSVYYGQERYLFSGTVEIAPARDDLQFVASLHCLRGRVLHRSSASNRLPTRPSLAAKKLQREKAQRTKRHSSWARRNPRA